jgi:hypothetical protein
MILTLTERDSRHDFIGSNYTRTHNKPDLKNTRTAQQETLKSEMLNPLEVGRSPTFRSTESQQE